MRIFTRTLLCSTLLAGTALCWAARDFTPQAGTWVVSSEVDGNPGRGLAIDVQGNTFFMQVFGYEKNGDATFYTATGQLNGTSVTAPLVRYTGGRSFGSGARDATVDGSPGNVTVSFSNGLKGKVQFPGEAPAAIERFLVKDFTPSVSNPLAQVGSRKMRWLMLDENLQFSQYRTVYLERSDATNFKLSFADELLGNSVSEVLPCTLNTESAYFHCETSQILAAGSVQSATFQVVGANVAGEVQFNNSQTPQTIMGLNDMAMEVRPDGGGYYNQQNYYGLAVVGTVITGSKPNNIHQLMPINGTWIVEDELTGKPGRGLALDVQDSTIVLQIFNYSANGQPTFHMGNGTYASSGANTEASNARFSLNRYAGGRSFGGPAQSAQLKDEAGQVDVSMSLKNANNGNPWAVATVHFPGEGSVRIRRLEIDSQTNLAERVFGEWYWPQRGFIKLDRVVKGKVTNADGSIVCWQDTTDSQLIQCGAPEGALWKWVSPFRPPLLNRGGGIIQIRDRFGNLQGLGKLQ